MEVREVKRLLEKQPVSKRERMPRLRIREISLFTPLVSNDQIIG